ncbi:MAG: chorismate mutase [Candidatus Kryptoniota bacterium]
MIDDELKSLRKKIDRIDRKIVKLLNMRAKFAHRIGEIKGQLQMEIYLPQREEEVLRNVSQENSGPMTDESIISIFKKIIEETRKIENRSSE